MRHGACYLKAWDYHGEETSSAKGTLVLWTNRISLVGGPSPVASLCAKRPQVITEAKGQSMASSLWVL